MILNSFIQVTERDERVSLLLQQLTALEQDCARDIDISVAKHERSKRQVKRLKRLCSKVLDGTLVLSLILS